MNFLNQLLHSSTDESAILGLVYLILGILFFLGLFLLVSGYKKNQAWKVILGILLTGIIFGLLIILILFLMRPPVPQQEQPARRRKK